jgi:hypothetical protein
MEENCMARTVALRYGTRIRRFFACDGVQAAARFADGMRVARSVRREKIAAAGVCGRLRVFAGDDGRQRLRAGDCQQHGVKIQDCA